jgi:hypothetical protein
MRRLRVRPMAAVFITAAASSAPAVTRSQPQPDDSRPQLTLRDAHWESLCSVAEWADRASAVENACCTAEPPPVFGSGHRRTQATTHDQNIDAAIASTSCALPSTCPSQECAEVFLPLRYECKTFVDIVAGQANQLQAYSQLQASCEDLLQAPPLGESAYESQVFCDHERVLCDDQADCHLECADVSDEVEPGTCAQLMAAEDVTWFNDLVASHPVVFFGTRRDSETSAAGRTFYEQSVCTYDEPLDNGHGMFSLLRYLRCLYPRENVLGTPATSFIFIGHKFFGNGLAVSGLPPPALDARLARAGAERTCGMSEGLG